MLHRMVACIIGVLVRWAYRPKSGTTSYHIFVRDIFPQRHPAKAIVSIFTCVPETWVLLQFSADKKFSGRSVCQTAVSNRKCCQCIHGWRQVSSKKMDSLFLASRQRSGEEGPAKVPALGSG